jgi:AcrR family transcriptional regulator
MEREKPLRKSRDERQKEIVLTAKSLLLDKGFKFTTKEVAEQIGVTEALIFHHFPTKKEIIQAIYAGHFDEIKQKRDMLGSPSAENIQKDLVDYFFKFYRNGERTRTLELLYLYALEKKNQTSDNTGPEDFAHGLSAVLVNYFKQGIEKVIFREDSDPEVMAEMIHNVFFHFLFFHSILKNKVLADDMLKEKVNKFVTLFLHGALKPGNRRRERPPV